MSAMDHVRASTTASGPAYYGQPARPPFWYPTKRPSPVPAPDKPHMVLPCVIACYDPPVAKEAPPKNSLHSESSKGTPLHLRTHQI